MSQREQGRTQLCIYPGGVELWSRELLLTSLLRGAQIPLARAFASVSLPLMLGKIAKAVSKTQNVSIQARIFKGSFPVRSRSAVSPLQADIAIRVTPMI